MHKEEAGMLFECLGDPNRVKIVKLLYHTSFLTLVELEERIGISLIELKTHLQKLTDCNLIFSNESKYKCNKELVDTLMNFISTRCGCCS